MPTIGKRVRRLRKEAQLSQATLAKTLGIDQSTLSDIETDKNDSFAGKVLLKMAEVLGQSPFYILYGVDIPARNLTPDEAELLMAFRRAGPEQRGALLTMARALVPAEDKRQH